RLRATVPGLRRVGRGPVRLYGRTVTGYTAADAAAADLEQMCAVLEAAGVPYFLVPAEQGSGVPRPVVGVEESYRGAVLARARQEFARGAGFVGAVGADGSVTRAVLWADGRLPRALRGAPVLRTGVVRLGPVGQVLGGLETGCDIEFWRYGRDLGAEPGYLTVPGTRLQDDFGPALVAPRRNAVSEVLPATAWQPAALTEQPAAGAGRQSAAVTGQGPGMAVTGQGAEKAVTGQGAEKAVTGRGAEKAVTGQRPDILPEQRQTASVQPEQRQTASVQPEQQPTAFARPETQPAPQPAPQPSVTTTEQQRVTASGPARGVPTFAAFAGHGIDQVCFPVDAVYTWVDGDDPVLAAKRRAHQAASDNVIAPRETGASRYTSHDELKYALRSLEMYAGFVRHVYLVTDSQTPDWLDPDTAGLTVIDHRDILPADALPVFNSHAIE
ncbi:Stealth CR1 domain-containing protein, partial [Streptomyces sp. SID161]|uniref:Stealth CR1 domain-containing protein n=1 Tax=Streptomyces sp. SID161 TaxID=2690251 RepID=UPI001F21CDE8